MFNLLGYVGPMTSHRLIIVGAGLCGLTAAARLSEADGWSASDILIVEAGAGVGGRLATERIGDAVFDHGAQFFTVRSEALAQTVETWLEAGVVDVWCRGFSEIDGYPRYRTRGGMQALARHLAEELSAAGVAITTGTPLEAVAPAGSGSGAGTGSGAAAGGDSGWRAGEATAGSVLLTPPVPASVALLEAGGIALDQLDAIDEATATFLAGFECHRVLALLAVCDRSPELASPGALQQPDDPDFSFVADNQAKGLSDVPAVTFHTAHARSRQLWDESDDAVLDALGPLAAEVVAPAEITELHLRRWVASGPVAAHPEPCLVLAREPGLLVLGGDGFGPSKVEGAFLSGIAAAEVLAG